MPEYKTTYFEYSIILFALEYPYNWSVNDVDRCTKRN